MQPPSRQVKCQKCEWKAIRRYGANGILVDPCPLCGSRVNYAAVWKGDQPVTQEAMPVSMAA
jgi:NAD-dependent SIR2 family protein deacetylase